MPQKQPQFGPHDRIEVQLAANIPLNRLTYQLKEHQWADIGQIVWVPVGAQKLVGLVIGAGDNEFNGRLRSPTEIIEFLPPCARKWSIFCDG